MYQGIKIIVAGLCGLLAACAIITVNVYFPEKDVKQAYKSLDEMLLKQGAEEKTPDLEVPPPEKKGEVSPQSYLRLQIGLVSEAVAAESVADALAVEVSSNPEVLTAYEAMKSRLPQIEELLASGAVGENKQGILAIRDKGKLGDKEPLLRAENENRKTVITAMAKAILKIGNQKESKAALNKILGQAATTYATTKQDQAKKGVWIELSNGRWVQK